MTSQRATSHRMKLGYNFGRACGASDDDCHFLFYRYDARHGFSPGAGESHVWQIADGTMYSLLVHRGWFTGLWRSPTGSVFVSDAAGRVFMNPDVRPRAAPWQHFDLRGVLDGVWGLDDTHVFAWGQHQQAGVVHVWDGARWSEATAPGLIVGMHGIAPDLIHAVGHDGLIARWDGTRFERLPSPTQTSLSSVFVASPDEMYAAGPGRRLLAGSLQGWREVLTAPGMLHAVAKWRDTVWVGAGSAGLMALKNGELVSVKPNILAESLEAREALLICSPEVLAATHDGTTFAGTTAEDVAKSLGRRPPLWLERAP